MTSNPVRVALGQYDTGWHDPQASLRSASRVIERAAQAGAKLVLLPEMCTTGFTMESAAWAEFVDGASVTVLRNLAASRKVHLLAGVATREGDGSLYNSALLISPDGAVAAQYRKQRLFAKGGEHASYQAGDAPVVATIEGVRVALLICYDLRFAELFSAVAPQVDAILLIANWPAVRREHWDVLVRARAIESQCYVAAVNRIGSGGGAAYDGGSVIYGPWGELLCAAESRDASAEAIIADIDAAVVQRVRDEYPFLKRS